MWYIPQSLLFDISMYLSVGVVDHPSRAPENELLTVSIPLRWVLSNFSVSTHMLISFGIPWAGGKAYSCYISATRPTTTLREV